ncbi:MAG: VCBS repeat-containing protein [Planctomycetes bacterium]|nr:VCBS repeat-containing protein [Planctomycetota bacterium]
MSSPLPLVLSVSALTLAALTAQQFRATRAHELPTNGPAMVVGDVDGDGHPDLVFGGTGSVVLVRNDGRSFADETAARFPPPTTTAILMVSELDLADLDGDGDLDLLIACANERASVIYRNNGAGVFSDATAAMLPPATYGVLRHLVIDVDLDNDLDVLVDVNGGQDRLLQNDGTGVFTDVTQTALPASAGAFVLAACDLDGDLDADLLLGPIPTLWINDGTGRFTVGPTLPVPLLWTAAVAELNGDGQPDIVTTGFFANTSTLLLSQPGGGLAPAPANGVPAGLRVFDFADIDEDGDTDIVGYQLLLNDGTGVFTDATAGALAPSLLLHKAVAVADLDRDGDRDVLFVAAPCFPGCLPEVMLNHRIQLVAPRAPYLGLTYDLQIFATRDASQDPVLAIPFASLFPDDWILPGVGWLGISPVSAVALPWTSMQAGNGTPTLSAPIPPSPGLWGLELYFQALVLMQDGRLLRTNALVDRVQ